MPPTPRRTPRKLHFGVIEETPLALTKSRQCVVAERSSKVWIPALVPRNPARLSAPVEALFADGGHAKVLIRSCKRLELNKGDTIRIRDDPHAYTVVRTFKTADRAQFALENGDDAVELLARRGGRTIKALVRNIFFHSTENLPDLGLPLPRPTRIAPVLAPPATRKTSVMENGSPIATSRRSQLGPAPPRNLFTDCVFVVGDDIWGNIETGVRSQGGITLNLLSDLLDTANLPDICYNGPPGARFFAVLGNAISPSPQFLQALSVGWPCLSTKFVTDSIQENRFLPWEDYLLGIAAPSGFIKSQSCFEFKAQWDMGYTLGEQFSCRSIVLGAILTPLSAARSISPDALLLISLASSNVLLVKDKEETPPGCIFIETEGSAPADCSSELRAQMCRQVRLPQGATLHAQWIIQCILNQKIS